MNDSSDQNISDLYTNLDYSYFYMGINDNDVSAGASDLNIHHPLFGAVFTSYVPNPTYIDADNGEDIRFCGTIKNKC